MSLGLLDIHTDKKNCDHYLLLYTQINSKQSVDLNEKGKKVKLLENNVE